ncbi:MAG: putative membrane-bound spermidine synthase [Flavobacteriaceae bacterium]|jgi:predicted membrane-bound spermidine synthase
MKNPLAKKILLLISFIEGGALMAFEVLCAKIYTPYLGASIYVWTSILTVTLIGLAVGYWLGGKLSLKNSKKHLLYALLGAAILVLLSTFIAKGALPALLPTDVKTASILSGFLILFFPVMLMGMVSPLIIGSLNLMNNKLSTATGLVFGIGTVGGVIFLLLTTFVLIPTIGVIMASYVLGSCLLLSAALTFALKIEPNEEK